MKIHHMAAISGLVVGTGGSIYLYFKYQEYVQLRLMEQLRQQDEKLRKWNKLMTTVSIVSACLVLSLPVAFRLKNIFSEFIAKWIDIWS